MTFSDWSNKKKKKVEEVKPAGFSSSETNNSGVNSIALGAKKSFDSAAQIVRQESKPSQPYISHATIRSGGPTFDAWSDRKYGNTRNVSDWVRDTYDAVNRLGDYYSSYKVRDDEKYQSYQKELSDLLSEGEKWRGIHDNESSIAEINSVTDMLSNNKRYAARARNYWGQWETEEDYNAGVTRLNTDIVSGKIPDMLLLDSSMPVDSYINKGLFEDLKPYIEKDSELDMDNFMPNIIEMCSKDGKMYILMPSFSIQTLVAKTSEVGAERGWTVQEAMDLWDSKPEGTEFLNGMTKENMLRESLNYASSQFIDWESGKCNFNSEDFVKMLEFSNRFPEEIDDDYYTDDYWENYDSQWRTGKVIASQSYIGDFRNYNNVKKSLFGEEVTMIGFPSSDGDGSVVMPGLQLTMSSKSANKDGVWEFLRTFLTDEYQSDIYGFKISIKHMEKMAQEATKKPYYEDENGNKVEYDDTTYIDGVEIVIDPMTQQEADEFLEQIYTFRQMYRFDEALNEIIEEEAAAYFSGQKSAKDVAGVIQSRVQIYVNETR